MNFKKINEVNGQKTFVVVLDAKEEAFSTLTAFAGEQGLTAASITAIGAFESATVGWFDFADRSYRKIPVTEQCEVLSLLGDVAMGDDGNASLHLHAVLGLKDGSTRGGHFLDGIVHPTLEATIVEAPVHLRRRHQKHLGIALIEI
ncbi:DNA-binding protein with PD1-like DNA-binding motif [Rhizobium sp. AC27/96]|uniref:PPC domain-containing DNA-binding protein n=1 Tax=Rhizobium TaxID=379 RepID=UPI0008282A75|nr:MULTISPECIES: PPC domain-containing DNA-binding protein [Rhizobium]NTF46576.1 DNA-binding protein [Rhizobium rhizogenes]OCI99631.1 DNA-binding protein with PD1-like DNA-binding motif [Rhizobium sp. AC27/96]